MSAQTRVFIMKYANSRTLRLVYLLITLVALVVAGGAPHDNGGSSG
jgi:hypothetical protein